LLTGPQPAMREAVSKLAVKKKIGIGV